MIAMDRPFDPREPFPYCESCGGVMRRGYCPECDGEPDTDNLKRVTYED